MCGEIKLCVCNTCVMYPQTSLVYVYRTKPQGHGRLTYDAGTATEFTAVMTTEQGSTFNDATEMMTTTPTEKVHQTTGSTITSSSSPDAGFYFRCAVVVIGVVGSAANGLVLYAMVASKQHKKNVLIFNQNLLDFVSCLFMSISYGMRLCNIYLIGMRGYWLCLTLLSEGPAWGPFLGSLINLAAITIERYLKVVHPALAKNRLRKWMIYSAAAFAWIGGTAVAAGATIPTTDVVDGVCYTLVFWKSRTAQIAFGIWYFLSFYVIILLIFIFFYWRILMAIRRQEGVMAAHSAAGSSTVQTQSKQIQTNIIKTMILVTALFAITWAPGQIFHLLLNIHASLTLQESFFCAILFITYLYLCINPFIYATKFDPVKRVLIGLIP